jgi:hypothetical protein
MRTCCEQRLARPLAASARLINDVQRIPGAGSTGRDSRRRDLMKRDVADKADVNLAKLHGRSDVDQLNAPSGLGDVVHLPRGNRGDAHIGLLHQLRISKQSKCRNMTTYWDKITTRVP